MPDRRSNTQFVRDMIFMYEDKTLPLYPVSHSFVIESMDHYSKIILFQDYEKLLKEENPNAFFSAANWYKIAEDIQETLQKDLSVKSQCLNKRANLSKFIFNLMQFNSPLHQSFVIESLRRYSEFVLEGDKDINYDTFVCCNPRYIWAQTAKYVLEELQKKYDVAPTKKEEETNKEVPTSDSPNVKQEVAGKAPLASSGPVSAPVSE
ncbi:MAG: hypothetical protein OEX12_00330 [Gammaproteobacteria bacterium]|nr:hypothetical protein [Gammaproteobacteria bacterium]